MSRLFHTPRKPGLSPGTVQHVGEKRMDRVRISVIDYGPEHMDEQEVPTVEECFDLRDKASVTWINVDGLHDEHVIQTLGGHFGVHLLVLEDVVNAHQRPKMEDYGDYIYLVFRMLSFDEEEGRVRSEQISLILGRNYVLSFQEASGDVFHPVRDRLRSGKGRALTRGADYLAYALLDANIDHYFIVLEKLGDLIEDLEEGLLEDPRQELLEEIHRLKREMIYLRRAVWPLREVVSALERGETSLIDDQTHPFLRDVYDHTVQVIDSVETFRDVLSSMQDLYLSSVSNRMNEVMKVLTIIATIFVPLTFIAGVYGMNFDFMPELHWRWSYPVLWVVILVTGGLMLGFFRRKRWL